MEKRRSGNDDSAEVITVIGEVSGYTAFIVDDEVDTAGTITEAVKALHDRGVLGIYAAATHGVLSVRPSSESTPRR